MYIPNPFCPFQENIENYLYDFFQDSGCSWSGPLNGLKAHLNVCQRDALDCLNQCGAKV